MIKKFLTVVLAFTLCFSSFACSVERQGLDYSEVFKKFEGELERGVTLQILENDTARSSGYLTELLDAFNAQYAEYNITAVDAKMSDYTDLAQLGPYGKGPDVIFQANDVIMRYADGRHVQPLPMNLFEEYDEYPANAWKAYEKTIDKLKLTFAVPSIIQTPMLYYREDKLPENWQTEWDKNANGTPDFFENWNDMYKLSKQILESNPSGSVDEFKNYGFMQSCSDQYRSSGFLLSYGAYIFGPGNDIEDIGLSKNDSALGAYVLRQLASQMNSGTTDDSITVQGYTKMARGNYRFVTSTPDTYSRFYEPLVDAIMEEKQIGVNTAKGIATQVLKRTPMPNLYPKSGDLTDYDCGWVEGKTMGGINGYALSAYCKYPKAAYAFIKFATTYEMSKKRTERMNLAPAREDLANETEAGKVLYKLLENGKIELMPSLDELTYVWKPLEAFFTDLTNDPFLAKDKQKYLTIDAIKAALVKLDEDIYKAIHILK